MQAQDFPYDPLKLFGTSRYGATTADIDDEVSRWLETHHPIEIFDKRIPYPSNLYLSTEKYGTLREVLNSLPNTFSYSDITQKYADLLATNQPVSVEPIKFFIKCLREKRITHTTEAGNVYSGGEDQIRSAQNAGEMREILSNCKQPGINQVMSDYIDYLQTKFIEFMMKYTSYSRYEAKIILQCNFRNLVIPFLEELTNLNRNRVGHDFIKSKLTMLMENGRMMDNVINHLVYDNDKYKTIRQILIDNYKAPAQAARAGIEDILTRVDRDVNARAAAVRAQTLALGNDVSDARPILNDPGSEDRRQFARISRIKPDYIGGGKRTKKRKQKRSTNKKRRVHKKRGRMSKRR